MRGLILSILCLQVTYISSTVIFPTVFTTPFRCFVWDSTCLKGLAKSIGPGYIQRIPEFSALRLDPMGIDFQRLDQDGVIFDTTDTEVHGLSDMIVDEISVLRNASLSRMRFRTNLLFTGTYKCNGTMFFQPISGEGRYAASLKNVEVEIFNPYNIVRNEIGLEFLDAPDYQFRYVVKDKANFRFDNLYYGDKERSDLMHSLLNANWEFITEQYGRIYISRIISTMGKAYRSYFNLVPLRSLVEF
ncbi:uncharacterized protein LOC112043109 [Bicyclus anynana]|uniref:Uncharacterized protein LOC112043109 n=1 Tax=Bicyclus anynana TaxID=110368 RepID=A0A6J1MUL0_BICAN|nr:uncharacterized protein LOC112043109 [Bicyclus anynana]